MKEYDYIIIGAGPAGISAALEIKCRNSDAQVLLLEKNASIGRKLRASGNGRCNISNKNAEHSAEVLDFLKRNGLAVRIYDNGLVYPYSESAADVVSLFERRLSEEGVEVRCNSNVEAVERLENGFAVTVAAAASAKTSASTSATSKSAASSASAKFFSKEIILSCGGKAGPQFGCIGDGYRFARKLGHKVLSPVPVLSAIECEGAELETIAGIRAKGRVKLLVSENASVGESACESASKFESEGACYREVFAEDGEIQFTKYGLSGICIFNMTRFMRFDKYSFNSNVSDGSNAFENFKIIIDLFPDEDVTEFGLGGILREDLAAYVEAHGNDIHRLEFQPSGIKGWKDAQCTSGGVCLDEIDKASCESKLVPGLYIVGELADYDGPCGGYNINNAIYSGLAAARHADCF